MGSAQAAIAAAAGAARAQTSEGPLKIVIPFPPGGHPDLVARVLSVPLAQLLEHPVVVENRAGAGGLIGAQAVLQSKRDGNTMIMNTASSAVFVALTRDPMPFNPVSAFSPVAMLGSQPLALAVGPSSSARSLAEFVAEAKRSGGAFSYGSSGVGSLTHVIAEYFKQQAGHLDIQHIPYKGSVAAVTDLAAGRLQVVIDTLSTMRPFVRDARIRQLAVFSERPNDAAPGVPTARQQGVDVVAQAYNIFAFPAGVPRKRYDQVLSAVQAIVKRSDFQATLMNALITIDPNFGPKECDDFIANEVAIFAPIVKSARIIAA